MRTRDLSAVSLHLVETVDEINDMMRWLGERREVLAFDLETGGLEWWKQPVRLVQFGDERAGWALDWRKWAGVAFEIMSTYEGEMVAHNAKFDVHFLEREGVSVPRDRVHDTLAMAHLLAPDQSVALKSLARKHVHPNASAGEESLKTAMTKNRWGWDTVPVDFGPYWQYGALDTVLTAHLYSVLRSRGAQTSLYDLEMACLWVLLDMETRGARVDLDYIQRERERLYEIVEEEKTWGRAEYGIENMGSDAQVIRVLRADGVRLTKRTEKGQLALDEDVLLSLKHPLAPHVLRMRKSRKIARTYMDNLLKLADGDIVHCSIKPFGARTGRMSVVEPALQTLPRGPEVRNAFVAREGNMLGLIDYDQVEMRMLAHFADEERMIDAIRYGDEQTAAGHVGYDVHSMNTRAIYGLDADDVVPKDKRDVTKASGFAILYGAGLEQFAWTAGIPLFEAEAFLTRYHTQYPGVKAFQQRVESVAMHRLTSEGEAYVSTILGRRQPLLPDKIYKGVNYIIQGSCADLLKRQIVDLDMLGFGEYMLLPVHDEIVFDIPEDDIEDVVPELVRAMRIDDVCKVPLTVGADVVHRWGDKYG